METSLYNIRSTIKIAEQVFENLPNDVRPGWAGLILSQFDKYVKDIPEEVKGLYPIIDRKDRWNEAHDQFTQIRQFGLANVSFQPESYLSLAELVAKVTFNASGSPAPFDHDSGHHIPSMALKVAVYFTETDLEQEVEAAILLFTHNRKFTNPPSTATDFLLYKNIDDILWYDWDPIGVNDIAPRDEYQSYVPGIFDLIKAKAGKEEIANWLFSIETGNMGLGSAPEKCLSVAEKIINASFAKGDI